MKIIYSNEFDISYSEMRKYHEEGYLQLGMDSITAKEMTNNPNILQFADNKSILKASWRAHNFWVYAELAGLGYTVYLSFTSAWWWFLIGIVAISFLQGILNKSNEQNLLDALLNDKGLYDAMNSAKRLSFNVDESLLDKLPRR